MEAGREVGSEKRPNWKGADEIGAVGESTRVSSAGKQHINEVGDAHRPEQWDGAEEEEGAKKQGNAESVPKDNEGLQASFERNGERREMHTAETIS